MSAHHNYTGKQLAHTRAQILQVWRITHLMI